MSRGAATVTSTNSWMQYARVSISYQLYAAPFFDFFVFAGFPRIASIDGIVSGTDGILFCCIVLAWSYHWTLFVSHRWKSDQTIKMEEHQEKQASPNSSSIPITSRPKGGLVTMPFIIGNEALEKVASYGLLPNMTFYLMRDYKMGVTPAQNLLFFWSAATNFLPVVGAFVADSYLGRFLAIGLGSIFSFLGTTMLWLTAMIPKARPPPCNQLVQACKSATTSQYVFLVLSFLIMSIGAGSIRSSSFAFDANQFGNKDNPNNQRVLETFFAWFYTTSIITVLIAMTVNLLEIELT